MRHPLHPPMLLRLAAALVLVAGPGRHVTQGRVVYTKFCKGLELTQLDYAERRDVADLKARLTRMVDGCQYIHGDLVLKDIGVDPGLGTLLGDSIREMETDFLDSVMEITGRLVLQQVGLRRVRLQSLRAIRGAGTSREAAALEVTMCVHPMEVELPNLTTIVRGDARLQGVADAGLFCRWNSTLDWSRVLQMPGQRFRADLTQCTRDSKLVGNCSCGPEAVGGVADCDPSCPGGRCWSANTNACQASGRCSRERPCPGCYRARNGEEECCDRECLGGCSGPGPTDCHSCARVSSDGQCQTNCPPREDYDPDTLQVRQSPDPMVRVGNVCARQCPAQFVLDSSRQYCLGACPPSETPVQGNCTKCEESGSDSSGCLTCKSDERSLNDSMAGEFSNCSVWLFSKSVNVDGSKDGETRALAWSALSSARYIYTDSLRITKTESLAANLSALGSLRHISGSLVLMNLRASFLGLASLETAKEVVFWNVRGLCRAWYPERHVGAKVGSERRYPIQTRVEFAPDDDPACAGAACHPQCRGAQCWGPGPAMCVACAGVRMRGVCHPSCGSVGGFPNLSPGEGRRRPADCLPCHPQCGPGGCSGPGSDRCVTCRNLREDGACVAVCGSQLEPGADGECYAASAARFAGLAAGLAALVVALLVFGVLGWRHYQRRVHKYDVVELDEYLADPSNPNDMVKLLIVNDDDVVKQKEIGSGAFGTVFRGLLRTDTVKGILELPVAIKVLRGSNPKLGQELLNEASVLARVQHPHCVRLVALCLTSEVQLITALMPRGCLLGFLHDHRGGIGAERMLSWALQVAEGMAYLESINIIHRDLAARNVLLKSPDEVKITDFGLARLLQESERQFMYTSGALPVKWLGIECFESGVFSHKSDVWSYGVLLWEICSYGESPYKPYRIASIEDITGLLRKGIRLNQPDICSVDFYNIMLACWLPYPDSRPSFADLTATMKDCLLCPSRYIAARSGAVDELDMEKAELIHSTALHQTAPPRSVSSGPVGEGYALMNGSGAALEPDEKQLALMNAAAANAAAAAVAAAGGGQQRRANSYVDVPEPRPQLQRADNVSDNDYLVPKAPEPATYDDVGYLEPQAQQQKPVDLFDDYLVPSK